MKTMIYVCRRREQGLNGDILWAQRHIFWQKAPSAENGAPPLISEKVLKVYNRITAN